MEHTGVGLLCKCCLGEVSFQISADIHPSTVCRTPEQGVSNPSSGVEESSPQQTPGHAHMGGSSILQRNGPCAMDSGPEQAIAITRKRTKRFAKQTQQVGKGAPCPLAARSGVCYYSSSQLQRTHKTPFGAAGPCREDSAPEDLPLSRVCMKSGTCKSSGKRDQKSVTLTKQLLVTPSKV